MFNSFKILILYIEDLEPVFKERYPDFLTISHDLKTRIGISKQLLQSEPRSNPDDYEFDLLFKVE